MRQRIEFIAAPHGRRARADRHALRAGVALPPAVAPRARAPPAHEHADPRRSSATATRSRPTRRWRRTIDWLRREPPASRAASSSARSATRSPTSSEDELVARWQASLASARRGRVAAARAGPPVPPSEASPARRGAPARARDELTLPAPLEGIRVARLHDRDGRARRCEHAARRLRRRRSSRSSRPRARARAAGAARASARRRHERPLPRAQPQQGEHHRSI